MSRLRPLEPAGPAILAGAATWLTLLSWSGLHERSSLYLVPLLLLTAGIALSGLLLRSLRLPTPVVIGLQTLGLVVVLNALWASSQSLGGVIPTRASLALAEDRIRAGATAATQWAAPIPGDVTAFVPLMVLGGCVIALLVDATACTLRQVPLAGLALLAAFTVPVTVLGGVSWTTFALAAAGFVLLLAADQAVRLGRWGRGIGEPDPTRIARDDQPHQVTFATLFPAAARLGAVGVGLAVLAPAVLPARDNPFDDDGGGSGGGTQVTLVNPLVDMRRDLRRDQDQDLVEVRTDQPRPSYLRLTVLDEFDGDAWEPSRREIPWTQRADGAMPAPPGLLSSTPRKEYDTSLRVLPSFETTWLPMPYPIREISVDGDWRFDVDTLDLVSADEDRTAAGLEYDVVELDLQPTAAQLVAAAEPPADVRRNNTDLPRLPGWVRDLAREVTDGAESGFEQATLLQRWFRTDGGFTYSLDRASGSGLEQLELFLGTGEGSRVGYCEQFASAMAMMARSLGIPARVAVGFLQPTNAGDDRWVYSSDDLHAWPELYFAGAGWLRFEPTPAARATGVPGYTEGDAPEPSVAPTPTASPSVPQPTPERPATTPDGNLTAADQGRDLTWPLTVLVGGAALVVLALAPRRLRAWARRRRLASTGSDLVEAAWQELVAATVDLRMGWDDHGTLRRAALTLAPRLHGSQPALAALEELVLLLERSRFSRDGVSPTDADVAVAWVDQIIEALVAGSDARSRRLATWLPASLWRRPGRRSSAAPSEDRMPV